MSKAKKLIPELRFLTFEDNWDCFRLQDIFDWYNGLSGKTKDDFGKGNFKYITYMDVFRNTKITNVSDNYVNIGEKESQNIVNDGDILFTQSSETLEEVGICAVYLGGQPVYLNSFCFGGRVKLQSNKMDAVFLTYALLGPANRKKIVIEGQGSTRFNLSPNRLNKTIISIPSIAEQSQIATFFSHIDKKIELLEKKIELLKEQKRGLLQKIFSQEIRFKKDDGSGFRNWLEVKLGSIGDFKTSGVDKKIIDGEDSVILINYMDIYNHKKLDMSTLDSLMKVTATKNEIEVNSVKRGDVLFTPSSETPDDIGHSEVVLVDNANVLFSYHLIRFRPNIDIYHEFLGYMFNNEFVLEEFSRMAQGATRFTLSKSAFENVTVCYPPELDEQRKITSLLMTIDSLHDRIRTKLKRTNELKRGLLQKMFI